MNLLIGARVCDSQQLCESAASTFPITFVKNLVAAGHRPALRSHCKVHGFNARKDLFPRILTPTLSHPMGEGEMPDALDKNAASLTPVA